MTLTIGLGLLGNTTQWYLPGTDPAWLPAPPPGAPPPVPGAISEVLAGPPGGLAFGGLVAISSSASGILLDVLGAWNSVKNASVVSDDAERLTLSGFVHADVVLGDGGDSFVALLGAKRGNVVTGDGDDVVAVEVATNGSAWVNEFRIATGAGEDIVTIRALDVAARAAAGDATFAATANGAGAFAGDDAGTRVILDLGTGDDVFLGLGMSRDEVAGGAGADVIAAGRGEDVLAGGAGGDIFRFAVGDGTDIVLDFTPGEDRLQLLGLDPAALQALLEGAVAQDGGALLTYGTDSVFLAGVAPAALSLTDLL